MARVIKLKAEALRERIARRNLTQNGFALQHVKISPGYMSELVNGIKSPSPAVRRRMLAALKETDFDSLFEFVDSETEEGAAT